MPKENGLPDSHSPLNLIAAYEKVLQILDGEIPLPEVVEVFLTNYCNFSCPHCRCKELHGGDDQHMDISIFEGLLAELRQNGIANLLLSGGGEPLFHPQISGILDLISAYSFRIGMITNGYELTKSESESLIEKIARCSDWVSFSLDGFSDETYQKAHGRRDISYGHLKETITGFTGLPKPRPDINIKMLVSELNAHEIWLAVEESLEMKADYLQFKFLEGHRLKVEDKEKCRRLLDERLASIGNIPLTVSFPCAYETDKREKKCVMNVLHPVVDWDGMVYLCCFFENRKERHSIGGIYESGFFKIWGSQKHRERLDGINSSQCPPNCPIMRYNGVVEFIKENHAHFKYI